MTDLRERSYPDLPPWVGTLLVVLGPVAYFWQAAMGRLLLAPGDAVLYLYPIRRLAAEFLARGHWPLWNPFVFSGFPFLAVSQTAVLHPGTWLFLLLPALWAMNLQMIATYAVAGAGTYAYARAVGAAVSGAALAGLTFPLSGFMFGHLGHTGLVQATALLPAVLWCAERLRHGLSGRRVAGGAAAVGLGVLAGHPQGTVLVVFTVTAYAAFFGLAGRPATGRWRYLGACGAMLAAGVLLGAAQWLPTAELVSQTLRARLEFREFTAFALPVAQVPTLLFPLLFGGDASTPYWGQWNLFELLGYTGIVPLMAAAAAVPLARRNLVVRFWILVTVLAFALTLGEATPLAALAYRVPVWNLFRAPARAFLQFDLGVAVLAALGASHALRGDSRWLRRSAVAIALATFGGAILVGAWGTHLLGARASSAGLDAAALARALAWHQPAVWWPAAVAGLGAIAWLAAVRRPGRARILCVLAVHLADVTVVGQFQVSRAFLRPDQVDVVPDYARWLGRHDVTAERGRVLLLADGPAVRSDLGRWNVAIANGYDPYILAKYSAVAGGMTYYGTVPDVELLRHPGFLDLLNVTHLVLDEPAEPDPPGRFARRPLDLVLRPGDAVEFALPRAVPATHLDIVSSLFDAVRVADGTPVARVSVLDSAGTATHVTLGAGADTAEWAWDNSTVAGHVLHRRAEVHESFVAGGFTGHRYVTRRALPAGVTAARVRVEPLGPFHLSRVSLFDAGTGRSQPCTREHALLADAGRWEAVGQAGNATILRNRHALPRAWFVGAVRTLTPEAVAASARTGRLPDGTPFIPRSVALVEQDFGGATVLDGSGEVRITRYEPNRVELRSRSTGPGFVVLADTFYPGWRASVDGVETPIVRVNGTLRGLVMPAGQHVVLFTFHPRSLVAGAAISGATVAVLGATLLGAAWRRRRLAAPSF